MIKLSDLLESIPCAHQDLMVQEARRLEKLDDIGRLQSLEINQTLEVTFDDSPPIEFEAKPLFDNNGDGIYLILDNRGKCVYWTSDPQTAGSKAKGFANTSGQPHSTAVVMAPDSGKCGTVVTVIFFPDRPHEWAIYNPANSNGCPWFAVTSSGDTWLQNLHYPYILRFDTAPEAQAYIDKHGIENAYPWAVPVIAK